MRHVAGARELNGTLTGLPRECCLRLLSAAVASFISIVAAEASANVPCDLRTQCAVRALLESRAPRLASELGYAAIRATATTRPRQSTALTSEERMAFSGIGAIVCDTGDQRTASTAFLVGGFDIAVTVAHTFVREGGWAAPSECSYGNVGWDGYVHERIPLQSFHAQWQAQPETLGVPTADLAVVRLREPVRFAGRTMSLTEFGYTHAPVVLVGFHSDPGTDTRKRKSRGNVYPRLSKKCVRFAHDVDSRGLTAGAPLIDVRDGVVIGIHTRLGSARTHSARGCVERGNGMITMNDWLAQTLRAEIARRASPGADEAEAGH